MSGDPPRDDRARSAGEAADVAPPPWAKRAAEARPAPWMAGGAASVRPWRPVDEEGPPPAPAEEPPEAPDEAADEAGAEAAEALPPEPPEDAGPAPCPHCEETRRQAAEDMARLVERLQSPYREAAGTLHRAAEELGDRFAGNVVDLALRLARSVVQAQVTVEPARMIENLQRALRVAGPVTALTLRCHADDAEVLRQAAPPMAEEVSGRPVEVTVRPSADVDRGACIVLFAEGIVDARWTTQLERMARAVREALVSGAGPEGVVATPPVLDEEPPDALGDDASLAPDEPTPVGVAAMDDDLEGDR